MRALWTRKHPEQCCICTQPMGETRGKVCGICAAATLTRTQPDKLIARSGPVTNWSGEQLAELQAAWYEKHRVEQSERIEMRHVPLALAGWR